MNNTVRRLIDSEIRDIVTCEAMSTHTLPVFVRALQTVDLTDYLPDELTSEAQLDIIEEWQESDMSFLTSMPITDEVMLARCVVESWAAQAYANLITVKIRAGLSQWIGEVVLSLPDGTPLETIEVNHGPSGIDTSEWYERMLCGVDVWYRIKK